MKVLFDCHVPSVLAHGGQQIQAVNTVRALNEIGVDAEFVRWWDPTQSGDIIHFFGRINGFYSTLARKKGIKFVLADLLTAQGSRNWWQRLPHLGLRQFDRLTRGKLIASNFGWTTYRTADAVLALTPWEARLMPEMFGADPKKIHVVPNGVEEVFFQNPESQKEGKTEREDYLVCTATITERKRVLELTEAAVLAQTPVWIVGKPYSESDPYYQRFLTVQKKHPEIIRFEGPISDRVRMASVYRKARGFVLLSTMESLSLSALEAAASGCPLLLSDLPWARCTFEQKASYCPIKSPQITQAHLRSFYKAAPSLPIPERPKTWTEVALQLKGIYEQL